MINLDDPIASKSDAIWFLRFAYELSKEDATFLVEKCGVDYAVERQKEWIVKRDKDINTWNRFCEILRERRENPLNKYRCWKCQNKFEAKEKDPHICPKCNTDLSEE